MNCDASDTELLQRYATTGAEEAFAELVRRHIDFVYAAALRQARGAHRAEDVTQSVFTDLARKAASLSQREDLLGWLHTSARFAAAKLIRTEVRREQREREALMNDEIARSAAPEVDWQEVRPVLDEALADLRPEDRRAVLLRYLKDLPLAEVGAALRLSEDAARKRVDRALDQLREALARRGVTSTTAALAAAISTEAAVAAPASLAAVVTSAALAPAAAGGATAALVAAIHLMNTSNWITGAAALAGALAIGTAVLETRHLNAVTAELSAATAAYDAQDQRLQAMRRQLARVEGERTELLGRVPPPPAAPPAKRPPAAPTLQDGLSAASQAALQRGRELLAAHPELRDELVAYQRLMFAEDYGPLYRALELTPEQIALFEEVLRQRSSFSFGIGDNTLAFSFAVEGADSRALEGRLRSSFGPEKYAQYQDFVRSASVRRQTTRLASALYHTDSPLSPAQAEQVTRILTANRIGRDAGGTAIAGAINWEQTMRQAQDVLTARQLQALQGLRTMDQYVQALITARYTPPKPAPNPSTPIN